MSAEVIAWLRSDEGLKWSRERALHQSSSAAPSPYRYPGPVDPVWDPCGRPHPSLGEAKDAARGEVA